VRRKRPLRQVCPVRLAAADACPTCPCQHPPSGRLTDGQSTTRHTRQEPEPIPRMSTARFGRRTAKKGTPMSSPLAGSAPPRTRRRLLLAASVLGGLSLSMFAAAAAQAATVTTSTPCGTETLTQPFLPWGDSGYYSLVPGGSFEGPRPGGPSLAARPRSQAASPTRQPDHWDRCRSPSRPAPASSRRSSASTAPTPTSASSRSTRRPRRLSPSPSFIRSRASRRHSRSGP
jgi:hypothetical protein